MLQKINVVLLAVMVVIVALMMVQARASEQRNLAAIERVAARLEETMTSGAGPESVAIVYVKGEVKNPGPYQFPASGLGVRRALDSAGTKGGEVWVSVEHRLNDGKVERTGFSSEELVSGRGDISLSSNDIVTVGAKGSEPDWLLHRADEHPGLVYITGLVKRPGPYQLPAQGGMTVRRALIAAGLIEGDLAAMVSVVHKDEHGQVTTKKLTMREIVDSAGPDIDLWTNDIVSVKEEPRIEGVSVAAPAGSRLSGAVDRDALPVIYVRGAVRNPGPYYVRDSSNTLLQVIDRAGGVVGDAHSAVITHGKAHEASTALRRDMDQEQSLRIELERLRQAVGPEHKEYKQTQSRYEAVHAQVEKECVLPQATVHGVTDDVLLEPDDVVTVQ